MPLNSRNSAKNFLRMAKSILRNVNEAGAYEIERLFSMFVVKKVKFSAIEKIRSHFGALEIDGVKVEIMGDIQKRLEDGTWEEPVNLEHHIRFVEVEGMQVPVLALEYENQAYMKLGRVEKAQMLKQVLEGEGPTRSRWHR